MAAGTTMLSAEEYLANTYRPNCEYIDGALRQKTMPTRKHGLIQSWLIEMIRQRYRNFEPYSEGTVRVREGKYLVPDVAVQSRDHIQDPYPTDPIHLCVEVLSPDDRISEVFAKCEDYHAWGVADTWVLDPETQRAWEYRRGELPREVAPGGSLHAGEVVLSLPDVFSVLSA